ncbi:MAG TPA: cytochrome b6-f complex subunit PetL [Candidatus Caenarcaniphilales bacterium]
MSAVLAYIFLLGGFTGIALALLYGLRAAKLL